MLHKLITSCLILVMMLATAFGMAQPAYAQPPPIPHQFYGNVIIDGDPAPQGTTVSVKINGAEVASTTTDAQGRYGYDSVLQMSGSNGATVEFYVNGAKAQETSTLSAGAITSLDLSAGEGSAPPSEPPPPPPPPAPPPPGSEPPPSPSSPPSPPSGSVSIATTVLGQAGTIQLSQAGVLQNAIELSSADGAVKLSFEANTTVTIQGESLTVTKELSPPSPPEDIELIDAYKFSPSNTEFNPALTLALKYDAATLPQGVAESGLFMAYWDGSDWLALTTTVDSQSNSLTAQVGHFTIFAILGMTGETAPPSPASFAVSNLNISPTSVKPAEQVTITAVVSNSGGSEGSCTVVLKINGVSEAEEEVTLGPGETQEVTFTVSQETPGAYNITIDGQSGAFTVSAAGTSPSASFSWLPIGAVALAVLLLVLVVILLLRRRAA